MAGIASLPGFDESLRLLIDEERYSLTDIALMFETSRERIRQHATRRGLSVHDGEPRGVFHIRVWDDTRNRFVPMSRGAFSADRNARRRQQRRAAAAHARAARLRDRRAALIAAGLGLARSTGYEPSIGAILAAIGRPVPNSATGSLFVSLWGTSPGPHALRRAIAEFSAQTGLTMRRRGRRRIPYPANDEWAEDGVEY